MYRDFIRNGLIQCGRYMNTLESVPHVYHMCSTYVNMYVLVYHMCDTYVNMYVFSVLHM